MARETKQELQARIAADNAAAAALDLSKDLFYDDALFGTVDLIRKSSETVDGWDNYIVRHSGFQHVWSSASINTKTWRVG